MADTILKVDENTVAQVKEARAIYYKTDLESQRAKLVERIAEIDVLLGVFKAA